MYYKLIGMCKWPCVRFRHLLNRSGVKSLKLHIYKTMGVHIKIPIDWLARGFASHMYRGLTIHMYKKYPMLRTCSYQNPCITDVLALKTNQSNTVRFPASTKLQLNTSEKSQTSCSRPYTRGNTSCCSPPSFENQIYSSSFEISGISKKFLQKLNDDFHGECDQLLELQKSSSLKKSIGFFQRPIFQQKIF